MQHAHNQTGGDNEAETDTDEPTMRNPNTDNPTRTTIADGGTEAIRDYHEIQHTDAKVRSYSADGQLYAYREDDEHVVVSRGNEPRTKWTKRVPAERQAVVAGEHLWTIPENWRRRLDIKGAGHARYAVYNIPETGVDVLVSVPNKTRLVDAWYGIKRVGTFNATFDGEIAWDELEATIETVRDIEEVSDEVVDALETLHSHRGKFESVYVEEVNRFAEDAVLLGRGTPTVKRWISTPWKKVFEIDQLVQSFLDVDNETLDTVTHVLFENDIIPYYPAVRVDVEKHEGIPSGYDIRALTEAKLSGDETIDYLMTEHHNVMSQSEWAEIRDTSLDVISENVCSAKKKLAD